MYERVRPVSRTALLNEWRLGCIEIGTLDVGLSGQPEEEVTVRPGNFVVIPPNVPHRALALEDTVDMDIFSPIRQDWLDGTDTYFHRKPESR